MDRPHPTVVNYLKDFDPNLVVRKNPTPEDPYWHRWFVCERVLRMYLVDESGGLFMLRPYEEPVLRMPQAMETDRRVLQTLAEARWANVEDAEKVVKRERKRVIDEAADENEAWARDKGYWYFKKSIEEYNLALLPNKDPHGDMKRWEDKHGQEYMGDKPY